VDPAETKSGSSSLIAEQTEHQYVSEAYLVRVAIIAQGVLFLKLGRSGQQRLLELVSRHCALFLALRERERLQCFSQPASLITDLFFPSLFLVRGGSVPGKVESPGLPSNMPLWFLLPCPCQNQNRHCHRVIAMYKIFCGPCECGRLACKAFTSCSHVCRQI